MDNSKNNRSWEKIFDKYKIIDTISNDGHAIISSTQINEFREARLMTKFDHKSQLPGLFIQNKLSVLPISRGSYVIGTFETFSNFNKNDTEITSSIEFPPFLESLDYRDITSEATAINCAFVSKILHDFTEEENLFPTVSGRMSSLSFSFDINSSQGNFKVNVENSQIEIDGGYEGDNSLNLIEAKNYISDDFLIRQLYYPYRLWSGKIQKKVRPVFLTYSNGVFHLREYTFSDVNHYNSLILVKQKKYAIQEVSLNIETLIQILDVTKSVKEPEIPFPQADSFERVINLCELIKQKNVITKEEITQNYDFDTRQTDYYTNAARYLGLVGKNKRLVGLSELGNKVMNMSLTDRHREFVKLIVSHKAFKQSLRLYLEKAEMPGKNEIVEIMLKSELYNIGAESTYGRRALTIKSWINWIITQIYEG